LHIADDELQYAVVQLRCSLNPSETTFGELLDQPLVCVPSHSRYGARSILQLQKHVMIALPIRPQLSINDSENLVDMLLRLDIGDELSRHNVYFLELAAGACVTSQSA
jgi:hypothetical protein